MDHALAASTLHSDKQSVCKWRVVAFQFPCCIFHEECSLRSTAMSGTNRQCSIKTTVAAMERPNL